MDDGATRAYRHGGASTLHGTRQLRPLPARNGRHGALPLHQPEASRTCYTPLSGTCLIHVLIRFTWNSTDSTNRSPMQGTIPRETEEPRRGGRRALPEAPASSFRCTGTLERTKSEPEVVGPKN